MKSHNADPPPACTKPEDVAGHTFRRTGTTLEGKPVWTCTRCARETSQPAALAYLWRNIGAQL